MFVQHLDRTCYSLLAEVSLSFLSFLPRRERPLLAGNSVSDLGVEQTFKWIIMFAHISLTSHQIQQWVNKKKNALFLIKSGFLQVVITPSPPELRFLNQA